MTTAKAVCRFYSCSENLKPGHYLCTKHWKMEKEGTISKCEQYKDAKYPLCISCNQTKGETSTAGQRTARTDKGEAQAKRKYDVPQADTFAQRSAMLEEDRKAEDKRQLFHDQQMKCAYCGKVYKYNELEIEHIIPKKLGGPDHIRNSQLACRTCNLAKGTMTDIEFRQKNASLLPQKERTPASPPIDPKLLQVQENTSTRREGGTAPAELREPGADEPGDDEPGAGARSITRP